MEMSTLNSKKLGEILVAKRFITFDQLMKAIEIQKKTDEKLGEILRRDVYKRQGWSLQKNSYPHEDCTNYNRNNHPASHCRHPFLNLSLIHI